MDPEIAAELDRQLSEQRAVAESLSTRAGVLLAVAAAVLGLTATISSVPVSPLGFWLLAVAMVAGAGLFWMARVGTGPSIATAIRTNSAGALVDAKLLLVEANRMVLTRAQVVFTAQVLLEIGGIVALVLALWPLP